MASNGTSQGYLYQQRGGFSDGNSNRNRSMEQYYGGSGNPNMPMWNTSQGQGQQSGYGPSTGYGGQAYNYGRYVPPTMTGTGLNSNVWNQSNGPYSYNTPNSFGSNFMGGNFYTPYQSAQYGQGMNSPLPAFGNQGYGYGNSGGFNQTGGYGQQPSYGQMGGQGGYGNRPTQGQFMPQWEGTQGFDPNSRGRQTDQQERFGRNTRGGMDSSPMQEQGFRFGRHPANPDSTVGDMTGQYSAASQAVNTPQFSPAFTRFLGMGY